MSGLRTEALGAAHDRSVFHCGVPELDDYLVRQASQDVRRRVAAVFVLVREDEPGRILGYYTLSSFAVRTTGLPDDVCRKLPRYPTTPATLIGRLARDTGEPGIGGLLLADALKRILASANEVASALVVVEAKDETASAFYRTHDFIPFEDSPRKLFLPMRTISAAMQ
jgi:hypothetical protein